MIAMIGGLSFGAPLAGGLALLAIPAIIAIHFLQLPSRPAVSSTLFLLLHLTPESRGGSRWQRLRQSVPLWLQLLAALLAAWVLAAPRWRQADSMQTLAVVLDSSVSMRAFLNDLRLTDRLRPLESAAAKTEWLLMESDPAAPLLYRGSDLTALEKAARAWKPRLGHHDPAPALRLAQQQVAGSGDVLFITDHPITLPPGVSAVGIGVPLENVGFSGVRATPEGWEVMVRNYGSQPQSRDWWVQPVGPSTTDPALREKLELAPGEVQTIRGSYPENGKLEVRLDETGERFTLDNRLPLIRPRAKALMISLPPGENAFSDWLRALVEALPESRIVTRKAKINITHYDPAAPPVGQRGHAVVLAPRTERTPEGRTAMKGFIAAENHPLIEGLNWGGLLVPDAPAARIPTEQGDRPLLWLDEVPLIFLREQRLMVNFDPADSNATRLPAFAILLHRYLEQGRAQLPAEEARNVETHQRLSLPTDFLDIGTPLQFPASDLPELSQRAPAEPGFFALALKQTTGQLTPLLDGAAYFADAREADFRQAASLNPVPSLVKERQEAYSERDATAPLWLLALGGVMLMNWYWQERRGHA